MTPEEIDAMEDILETMDKDHRLLRKFLDDDEPTLSDEQLKVVETIKAKGKVDKDDVKSLLKHFPHPDKNKHNSEAHDWNDDTLHKYAEHIKNYIYHYKPEAKELDPSIDPEVEHNGPMAQDIEKVNPAAVITDEKTGYKSVDTGRLALMNAGAIADLARKLEELEAE